MLLYTLFAKSLINASRDRPKFKDISELLCDKNVTCSTAVIIIIIITSTSDLQSSTAVANQLPGQLVRTQIRTRGPNYFNLS